MIDIKYIFSFVPKNYTKQNNSKEFRKIISYTGFKKLHVLSKSINNKDFIYKSCRIFFNKTKIKPRVIEGLIYSSHSRQVEMPIFSASIQNYFKLNNSILCYDLPNSCAGFTNSLIHAYSLITSKLINNILIINSDTHSKHIDSNSNLKPVIGDGCTCVFIESSQNIFYCDYGVDGKDNDILKISRSSNKLTMNGIKVFEFALKRVPETIDNILLKSGIKKNDIDYYSFHQPNKSMFEHIVKKLGLKKKKILSCFDFGNTSAASIPIAISKNFPNKYIKTKLMLFCGFGSGLSWSTVLLKLKNTFVVKIYRIL
jgi:3-oxoacyl-[acyl-carrier-protein] synthase-3